MNKQFVTAGLALVLGAGYSLTAFAQAKPERWSNNVRRR